jgi:hypothetical protein
MEKNRRRHIHSTGKTYRSRTNQLHQSLTINSPQGGRSSQIMQVSEEKEGDVVFRLHERGEVKLMQASEVNEGHV